MNYSIAYLIIVSISCLFTALTSSDFGTMALTMGLISIVWGFFYVIKAIEESK